MTPYGSADDTAFGFDRSVHCRPPVHGTVRHEGRVVTLRPAAPPDSTLGWFMRPLRCHSGLALSIAGIPGWIAVSINLPGSEGTPGVRVRRSLAHIP